MSISQVIIKQSSKVLDHKPANNSGYIVDEQGKEVQIISDDQKNHPVIESVAG